MKVLILNLKQPQIERFWGDESVSRDVGQALEEGGLEVVIDRASDIANMTQIVKQSKPDLVFPNGYQLIGEPGRPYVNDVLDSLNIPYVGSSADSLKAILGKKDLKRALIASGLRTPKFLVSMDGQIAPETQLNFPVMVKVDESAESVGIIKVNHPDELEQAVANTYQRFGQPVIVEEFIRNHEYSIAVLGNGATRNVMPVEICVPTGFEFFDETAKLQHVKDSYREVNDPKKLAAISRTVNDVCNGLGIKDWTRMELVEDNEDNLYAIDINSLPGMRLDDGTHPSLFPLCAKLSLGLDYTQTVNALVYEAMKRAELEPPKRMTDLLGGYGK